jgi:hypothetical protein
MPATIFQADLDASSVLSCFVGGNFKDISGSATPRSGRLAIRLAGRAHLDQRGGDWPAARTFFDSPADIATAIRRHEARKPKPGRQSKARTFVTSAGLVSNDQW